MLGAVSGAMDAASGLLGGNPGIPNAPGPLVFIKAKPPACRS